MKLPLDVALCDGNGDPVCESCARRIAERRPLGWYTAPIAEGEDCALFMELPRYELTETGREALESEKGGGK